MDPQEQAIQRERVMEANRREMERKSQDTLRIFNPLDEDFKFKFNGYTNVIKAHQKKDVARYLANHYFKKMSEYMIGLKQQQVGTTVLNQIKKGSQSEYDKLKADPYEENRKVWDKVPKLNDPEELKSLKSVLILGVVEEFGMELPETQEPISKPSLASPLDDMLNEINQKVVDEPITADEVTVE